MVGESAYPLRPFLLTPFGAREDALRSAFDDQLRKGLSCINDAFAALKGRWTILRRMNAHLMHAPQITVACCVLHNICQMWGEPEPEPLLLDDEAAHGLLPCAPPPPPEIDDEPARLAGEMVRDALFRDWVQRSLG
jgi:hypothetical protein